MAWTPNLSISNRYDQKMRVPESKNDVQLFSNSPRESTLEVEKTSSHLFIPSKAVPGEQNYTNTRYR